MPRPTPPFGPRPFTTHARRPGPRLLWALALAALLAAPAAAQAPDGVCAEALEEAEALYVMQAFGPAIGAARGCLDLPEASTAEVRYAYRLIVLVHLQQRNPRAAEETLAALLQADPGYRPDPVQDPPVYFAFADAFIARRTAPAARPSRSLLPGPLSVGFHAGGTAYGGERGVAGTTPFYDWVANVGPSAGVSVGLDLREWLRVGLRVDVHQLTSRFHLGFTPPTPLDRGTSSDFVWAAAVEATGRPPAEPLAPVRPTLHLGLGATLTQLNGDLSVGLLVQPGVGIEVPIGRHFVPFLRTEVGVVTPGEAVDLRNTSHLREGTREYDLLTGVHVGVRYVLNPR